MKKQKQKTLKQRYEDNLKRKNPLSKINIAELVYGKGFIEKYLSKLN